MENNKELLEATVKGLQDKIGSLNMELKDKQKELEDANKPVISSTVMNVINDAINYAVENYDFDNKDQYEMDFSLDYDSKVQAETINQARVLEGSLRNVGTHACGIIITPDDITNFVPIATAKDSNLYVTQYDNAVVESAGLKKMDF